MTKRLLITLAAVLVLVALVVGSQFQPPLNRVSGIVEADEIRVGSRLGGRVSAVHVEEGARVREGEVLVEFEPFDLLEREKEAVETLAAREAEYQRLASGLRSEEVAQAKARLDQLQAELDLAEAGPREQEIDAAGGRLRVAEAQAKLARENHERRAELFRKGAITKEEFDASIESLEGAEAQLVVRQEELELLKAGTRPESIRAAQARVEEARQAWRLAVDGYRQEEIEKARAARDAARAALEVVREQKQELTVTSPIDGVIEALDLQPGDLVAPGAPVLSIMDDRRLWVRAYVPLSRVALQTGQRLWVSIDGLESGRFSGEITFIARRAEFTPSNVQTPEERAKRVYRIKVALPAERERLRPGMTANVWLDPAGNEP